MSTTELDLGDGWKFTHYAGNPLGLQYGQPHVQITHHPWAQAKEGPYRDPHKCTERLTPHSKGFGAKLGELIAQLVANGGPLP